ncbi:glycoside hydrolase family 114 protein [Piromyces sp. E2]|nr:glycoside hydrolase family 114 protein [Piromyces sp. E2]|eukprot:OUM65821.1 glycoside hydrolase family 114 protein [Piromyces sp. E2]
MKLLLAFTLASSLLFNNIEARWKPNQHQTWNIILGSDIDVSSEKAEIVEIDYSKTELIKKFHDRGKKVICYFSGGTIEKWRDDKEAFFKVSGLVKNVYSDWPEERWLDYRVEGIKPLLESRIKKAISRNCDAIDIDNVDGYQIKDVKNWSNPLEKKDAIKFTTWLGETAHKLGISIGLKNCLNIVDDVEKHFDFAVNEGCIKRGECHWYKNFLKTGKPVLGITYNGLENNKKALCEYLNKLPISMIVKKNKKLVQDYITFDGHKYCGSDFTSGKVDLKEDDTTTTKTISANAENTPAIGNNPVNGTVINGNNTAPGVPANKSATTTKVPNDSDKKGKEVNEPLKEKEGGSGYIAGFAISGTVVGAAAVFVFLKKNPKKYEELKRGISRRATSVKRSATSVTRRLTTRGRSQSNI